MFTSTGLFKEVTCPKGTDCQLINCIFAHTVPRSNPGAGDLVTLYDPLESVRESLSPPPKRRRIEPPQDNAFGHSKKELSLTAPVLKLSRAEIIRNEVRSERAAAKSATKQNLPTGAISERPTSAQSPASTKTISRPISPPPIRSTKQAVPPGPTSKATPKEVLTPRQVPRPPAHHKARDAYLKLIHTAMQSLNNQLATGEAKSKGLVLSSDELVRLALDEEEYLAVTCGDNIYQQSIGSRIKSLRKMSLANWTAFVIGKFRKALKLATPEPGKVDPRTLKVTTGLGSLSEEIAILRCLRTPLEGLESYGYVTTPPSEAEIQSARKVIEEMAGSETCDRCGSRFRVFPGRNEEGRLTTNGTCTYHWGKIVRPQRGQGGGIGGQPEAHFACCNKPLGTEGCTNADTHVFKVSDIARLAGLMQFERTPEPKEKRKKGPVTFDCEMAYTTQGMELVRLTAVSWPLGKELLDVLVRPYGEILDLNTRFSGVTNAQFTKAIPYSARPSDHGEVVSEHRELEAEPLRKVDSPAHARQLLFDLLSPDTPLLGHAIDNDLNTCRIIHPFIVDTVLLYPHPKGLPIRYGLKMLAGQYLERSIQIGGDQGHDSKEDAVATGDLVSVKVAQKWKQMRIDGWRFGDGVLIEPEEEKVVPLLVSEKEPKEAPS